jgi:hypothetical protein
LQRVDNDKIWKLRSIPPKMNILKKIGFVFGIKKCFFFFFSKVAIFLWVVLIVVLKALEE